MYCDGGPSRSGGIYRTVPVPVFWVLLDSQDLRECVQLGTATSISSVLPGALVTALVTATLSSGLNVKFFGYFDGTIDLFHLNHQDPETDFKVGQKIKARVIWDSIGSTPKKFSLSMAEHVLELTVATVRVGKTKEAVLERFPIGRVLDQVRVVRLDDEWGLSCEIVEGKTMAPAFVHVRPFLYPFFRKKLATDLCVRWEGRFLALPTIISPRCTRRVRGKWAVSTKGA